MYQNEDVEIMVTIERITEQTVCVSIGGENKKVLYKSQITYNDFDLIEGDEIEITMTEKYAIEKGFV